MEVRTGKVKITYDESGLASTKAYLTIIGNFKDKNEIHEMNLFPEHWVFQGTTLITGNITFHYRINNDDLDLLDEQAQKMVTAYDLLFS